MFAISYTGGLRCTDEGRHLPPAGVHIGLREKLNEQLLYFGDDKHAAWWASTSITHTHPSPKGRIKLQGKNKNK